MNSHPLKGVATMAELAKTDARQPLGKIKPTDKMVMMPLQIQIHIFVHHSHQYYLFTLLLWPF